MKGMDIQNISYKLPNDKTTYLFKNFSLKINTGENIGIFGPNGCGKTTLFNLIAGIYKPFSGKISINGKPSAKSKIAYIFQDYRSSLFPWYTVKENILLPLKIQKAHKRFVQKQYEYINDITANTLDLSKYPYQLSGGQQQYTVILRGLVMNPGAILFDEPFSALDQNNIKWLINEISQLLESTSIPVLTVAHDQSHLNALCSKVIYVSGRPLRVTNEQILNMEQGQLEGQLFDTKCIYYGA